MNESHQAWVLQGGGTIKMPSSPAIWSGPLPDLHITPEIVESAVNEIKERFPDELIYVRCTTWTMDLLDSVHRMHHVVVNPVLNNYWLLGPDRFVRSFDDHVSSPFERLTVGFSNGGERHSIQILFLRK